MFSMDKLIKTLLVIVLLPPTIFVVFAVLALVCLLVGILVNHIMDAIFYGI